MASAPATDLRPQRTLVARLRERLPRSDPRAPVEVVETHISWVLLTGAFAYKIKKAIDLGFLDFTTLAARRDDCERELRLNRRLAASLYLDVVAFTGTVDAPVLGGDGPALEYAVRMREFPQAALASRVLARGELAPAHIDALAAEVAGFHARMDVAPATGGFGTPAEVLRAALANFDAVRPGAADAAERTALDALLDWTRGEHAAHAARFAARRQHGFVRECHGDLHLGNMVMIDGRLTIFDCIEFNDRLRWIDVISEVAFVVMDLEDRGAPALAHRFLDAYLGITGDYAGLAVLRYYLVYRAMVRAKVTRLRARQLDAGARREAALAEYRGYLDLAARFSRPPRAALVITNGLSGSGKTTLTQELLELTGALRIRTDVERKRLFGLAREARTGSGIASGLYAEDATDATYRRVEALAREVATAGEVAIVDATFLARRQRDRFRRLAAELGIPFVIVAFEASEATLRRRIAARAGAGADASEADAAVLDHQLATQEPLAADERRDTIVVDAESAAQRAADPAMWHGVLARLGLDAQARAAAAPH